MESFKISKFQVSICNDFILGDEIFHNVPINLDSSTALHFAAYQGHEEIVNFLIDCGADVNMTNLIRDTPLMLAARKGNIFANSIFQ